MLYLIAAILCSASIALLFKRSESSDMNRYAVTTANYAMASLIAVFLIALTWDNKPAYISITGSLRAIARMFLEGAPLPPRASLIWSLTAGAAAGVVFFLGFIYYQLAIRRHGVSLSGAFSKLGILVPMSLSLVLWREYPAGIQWLGIALAVASILIVNWPFGTTGAPPLAVGSPAFKPTLLLLALFGGLAEFSNKIFQKYGYQVDMPLFLVAVFGCAFFLSFIVTWRLRSPVHTRDLFMGAAIGIPNLFASFFLIRALETIPAAAAFPAYGAGTIIIINLGGLLLFRERLTPREIAGILATIAALVLINLR